MYYEEKFVNGWLSCRTKPDGAWQPIVTSIALAANQLYLLSEADRESVMGKFCKFCGSDDAGCQCWNDD